MRSFLALGVMMVILGVNNGCSVHKAANQPGIKDVNLFSVGTSRDQLIAEFGSPINSEIKDGKKVEIYKFVQGYSGGAKAGRAFFHGAADVVTLGLWELVGTPVEGAYSGDNMAFKVTFDQNDKVLEVFPLNDESSQELGGDSDAKSKKECDASVDFCD
jgi:hypothetical protein